MDHWRWRALREFGDLEMAIMQVMWAGDRPYVVREVRERMQYGRPVAYTTVMTVMNILHRKGSSTARSLAAPGSTGRWKRARITTPADDGVLRSGGDEDVTMRRFVERVNDEEMESLCTALATPDRGVG
jgi:predicted transcriptional regulator